MNANQIIISVWGLIACINYHFYKDVLWKRIEEKQMRFPNLMFNLAVIIFTLIAPIALITGTIPEIFKRITNKLKP